MRWTFFTAAASVVTLLTILEFESSTARRFAPLSERSMREIRGTNPGNTLVADDVCGSQNVTQGTGQQTAFACASANGGPQFPGGPCIDCGTQSKIGKAQGNMTQDNTKPNIACSTNLLKTGTCWRTLVNGAQVYSCMNAQPDNNLTTCNGTLAPTIKQAAGGAP